MCGQMSGTQIHTDWCRYTAARCNIGPFLEIGILDATSVDRYIIIGWDLGLQITGFSEIPDSISLSVLMSGTKAPGQAPHVPSWLPD